MHRALAAALALLCLPARGEDGGVAYSNPDAGIYEVSQALKRLSTADAQLATCDKDSEALKADLKKSLTDAQLASADVTDVVKAKRIEQEFADLAEQMELSRFTALGTYQDALMALEKAIGTRIEQVLRPGVQAR